MIGLRHRAALAIAAAWLAGCGSPSQGLGDASAPEAGPDATASVDDGGADGGEPADAGVDLDAGTGVDAETPDAGPLEYENPVLDVSGDPFCGRFGDRYLLYLPRPVRRDGRLAGGRVVVFSSRDLVRWTRVGVAYDNTDDAYGGKQTIGLWAPEVLAHGGRYYLYYASVMSDPRDPRVGDKDVVVVESDDPTDFHGGRRTVLLDGDYAFIDPSPFEDPATGRLHLLYKFRGAYGTGTLIRIRPLDSPSRFGGTATRLLDVDDVPDAHRILEHPMMFRQGGVYFLLFSKGDGAGTTYQVAYATSDRPTGPFRQRGSLFRSDLSGDPARTVISPGGSSIVRDGAGAPWLVYRQKTTTEHTFGDRAVCIDPIAIHPRVPSIEGTPTRGVSRPAPTPLP